MVLKRTVAAGLLLWAWIGFSTPAFATQILIKAEATREYTTSVADRKPDEPLNYHFVKGYFYGGDIKDESLIEVSFMEIAQNLAVHLTKQNYFPSKDTANNDVMIFVHWGVTAVEEDPFDVWAVNSMDEYETLFGLGDSTDESVQRQLELYGPTAIPDWGETDRSKNSALLGFAETLNDTSVIPQDQYDLESALGRERYFIVLMAYDYQKYLQEKEMEILWITRFSMKATGSNFHDAYKELTFAASDYFGRNMKGLQKKRTDDTSKVEMGDIEVLDTVRE